MPEANPFRQVQPGEPLKIPAEAWNQVLVVAQESRRPRLGDGIRIRTGVSSGDLLVLNNTGATLQPCAAVELQNLAFNPPAGATDLLTEPVIEAGSPTGYGPMALIAEQIESGAVGLARLHGLVSGRITIDHLDHRYADVVPSTTTLRTCPFGRFEVVWREGAVGSSKFAIVRPVPIQSVRFLARITGAVEEATHKWVYTWEEIKLNTSGNPELVTGGRTSAAVGDAINLFERSNTGSGVEGNGVDRANVPPGFEMKPAPVGLVVWLEGPSPRIPLAPWWTFFYSNADDGMC